MSLELRNIMETNQNNTNKETSNALEELKTKLKETKVCKCCGKELPISEFQLSSAGSLFSVCRTCVKSKRQRSKINKTENKLEPNPELASFDSRELIKELRVRGYRGELEYTKIEKVVI